MSPETISLAIKTRHWCRWSVDHNSFDVGSPKFSSGEYLVILFVRPPARCVQFGLARWELHRGLLTPLNQIRLIFG